MNNILDNLIDEKFIEIYNKDISHMNYRRLKQHYIMKGQKEGRILSNLHIQQILRNRYFNIEFYRRHYNDTHNKNIRDIINNYITVGQKEGRIVSNKHASILTKNPEFSIDFYKSYHPDLNNMNPTQLVNHYIEHGKQEGRISTIYASMFLHKNPIFDIEFYKLHHPDLHNMNHTQLLKHYIEYGKQEGRIVSNNQYKTSPYNIISISHNKGGGTQTYIDNLKTLYNINYEINIHTEEIFNLITSHDKYVKCNNTYDLSNIITDNTIVLFNHLLTTHNTINRSLFYNIYNNCKHRKIIFIIHDYHLMYPNNPNPIKNTCGYPTPTDDNLQFINDIFSKCDLVVFNSQNCFNNYKKYINLDNYKCIKTNSTPDILTLNYNIFPSIKSSYNIGIIGRVQAKHKGLHLLNNIANILPACNFTVLGVPTCLQNRFNESNIHLYGEYNNNNIFELIDNHNIDFFMFVSVFEETYSYVLSIAMQTGLPIFYNDVGCYRERLYGRQNTYAFDESNLTILPDLISTMEIDSNNNSNSKNSNASTKKYVICNNNADFNWMLEESNKYVFDVSIIKDYIINNNVCFIHFTNIGLGYNILLEQIDKIKTSGLYNQLDFIFIIMLGPHIKLINDPKCRVIYYSQNEYEWEFPTIKLIKSFSVNINKKVNILYIHTKGVLNKPNAKEWREYLEYFLISNHNQCLYYLNNDRDCVGVNINVHPKDGGNGSRCHFSGNFWWSNTNYIKNLLPLCTTLEKQDRYSSEHYIIGKYHSQPTNVISLHNCENNLYETPILQTQYNYDIIKKQVIIEYNNFNIDNYKKTICIYFISTIEFAESRFFTQIDEMLNSGFYDACEQILCFITGNNDNILAKLSSLSKVQIIQTPNNEMEKYCLNNYKKYINVGTYNVVYLHTKGASRSTLNEFANDWCKICNYFTINLWKLNMILLQYYSCIGINMMSYPVPHFSGNNWWATSEHLSNLKEPIGEKYLDPEMYILNSINIKNNNAKVYQPNPLCLFKSIGNHAGANYDEHLYKNLTIEEILDRVPQNYIYNNTGDNIPINLDRVTIL